MSSSGTMYFGSQPVSPDEKTRRVKHVFDSVAPRYDVMNDLMSLGVHRLWKRFMVHLAGVRRDHQVLDVAGGTGDLAYHFAHLVGPKGRVVLADINPSMLALGRDSLINRGLVTNVHYVQADVECLPFPDNVFDCVSIAFGLRNVTDQQTALASMYRSLKFGGRLLILEFSHVTLPFLKRAYDAYSFRILPWLGNVVAGDTKSYQYLVESIRKHPNQESLVELMGNAGFVHIDYYNLSGGIVAVHRGHKV
ncbi:MAG: bifunctional demethylmenaquinone methyltransferase/2-methoxy-6-polyprenyl-1,4-benzoquinol methylase UbiE [Gammaproteobacteria bacterium]|nr:bifunctional demethylmenaquinone methyltransferase/2-methoxy-6-polyprenyl-1,4-benzoquinol methylase UbiE [Gammaproteobacteria bacterium]